MGLFDGLKKFGLGNLEEKDVYEKEEKPQQTEEKNAVETKHIEEADCVYKKQFICPLCESKFSQPVVRASHMRLVGQDQDLRPKYADLDANKYDVIHCNYCGYAVLTRYFGPLAAPHKKLLKEQIEENYQPIRELGDIITYEDARARYQLALANAVVRKAHNSEKALICLKAAWADRGMQEELQSQMDSIVRDIKHAEAQETDMTEQIHKNYQDNLNWTYKEYQPKIEELRVEEEDYLKHALEGFFLARQQEQSPIAGMNDITLDYLLAALCFRFEQYDDSFKLLHGILSSKTAGKVQKEKARDMIEQLRQRLRQ